MKTTTAAAIALSASLVAAPAHARLITVSPGPGTPLQDAIAAAAPNDTLKLARGGYPEPIVIDRPLKILGSFSVLDGGCDAPAAVTVAADNVVLQDLIVQGGSVANVDVQTRHKVTLKRIQTLPSCSGVLYGVNAVATTRLTIKDGLSFAYDPILASRDGCPPLPGSSRVYAEAALRLLSTPAGGRARLVGNAACVGETTALEITDTTRALHGPASVTVQRNFFLADDRGIVLTNSDGVEIRSTHVEHFPGQGSNGILVDATSDDNLFAQNVISGYTTDASDAGSSNCWRMTTFTTGSVPVTGCP